MLAAVCVVSAVCVVVWSRQSIRTSVSTRVTTVRSAGSAVVDVNGEGTAGREAAQPSPTVSTPAPAEQAGPALRPSAATTTTTATTANSAQLPPSNGGGGGGLRDLTRTPRVGAPPYSDASVRLFVYPKSHAEQFWGESVVAGWPALGANCPLVKSCVVEWKPTSTPVTAGDVGLFVAGLVWHQTAAKWDKYLTNHGMHRAKGKRVRRGRTPVPVGVFLTELDDNPDRPWMDAFDFRVSYQPDAELFHHQACPTLLALRSRFNDKDTQVTRDRDKFVAAFVSNCKAPDSMWRTEYVEAFGAALDGRVHHFGRCWHNQDTPVTRWRENYGEVKREVLRRYRFALAFENTRRVGYVSEKVYDALLAGAIPLYAGAPDISDYVPPHSIINAADFGSATELAEYVKAVEADPVLEAQYHSWGLADVDNLLQRFQCMENVLCRVCEFGAWYKAATTARKRGVEAPMPWGTNKLTPTN